MLMNNYIDKFKLGLVAIFAIILFPITLFGYLVSALSKKRWWMSPKNWRNWRRWIYKN